METYYLTSAQDNVTGEYRQVNYVKVEDEASRMNQIWLLGFIVSMAGYCVYLPCTEFREIACQLQDRYFGDYHRNFCDLRNPCHAVRKISKEANQTLPMLQEIADRVFIELDYEGANVGCVLTTEGAIVIDTPIIPEEALHWAETVYKLADSGVIRF